MHASCTMWWWLPQQTHSSWSDSYTDPSLSTRILLRTPWAWVRWAARRDGVHAAGRRPQACTARTRPTTSKRRLRCATTHRRQRSLGASKLMDNYLNLLDWSSTNILAVALGCRTYGPSLTCSPPRRVPQWQHCCVECC